MQHKNLSTVYFMWLASELQSLIYLRENIQEWHLYYQNFMFHIITAAFSSASYYLKEV